MYCKIKKMLNEGNQIHKLIYSSGSGTVINCGAGSGSYFLQVTVPVPLVKKLRFLRFRFHNTASNQMGIFSLPASGAYDQDVHVWGAYGCNFSWRFQ
jgi:hypothetical protein